MMSAEQVVYSDAICTFGILTKRTKCVRSREEEEKRIHQYELNGATKKKNFCQTDKHENI